MAFLTRKRISDLQAEAGSNTLRRSLGPINLTTLGIGSVIGTGIFVLTGTAASQNAGPGLVISMVIYMLKAAKHMRRDIGVRLEAAAGRDGRAAWLAVFLFVVVMITREGMETAFVTASLFRQTETAHFVLGAVAGLGLAALLAWGWVRYGQRVNLALFFKVTSVFLVVFALQLILNAFHESTEANLLPIDNAYWHLATEPYGPEGPYGALITYGLVLVPAVWLMFAALQSRQVERQSRQVARESG